jgi:hypothetical protein
MTTSTFQITALPGALFAHYCELGDAELRAAGPIFVRQNASTAKPRPGQIPEYVARRLISVRAYDTANWMVEALVSEGSGLEAHFEQLFANPRIAYLHLHNARQGCYSCRVERA